MGVVRANGTSCLHGGGGDPDVVRGNWCAALPKKRMNPSIELARRLCDGMDEHGRLLKQRAEELQGFCLALRPSLASCLHFPADDGGDKHTPSLSHFGVNGDVTVEKVNDGIGVQNKRSCRHRQISMSIVR